MELPKSKVGGSVPESGQEVAGYSLTLEVLGDADVERAGDVRFESTPGVRERPDNNLFPPSGRKLSATPQLYGVGVADDHTVTRCRHQAGRRERLERLPEVRLGHPVVAHEFRPTRDVDLRAGKLRPLSDRGDLQELSGR
nr:hypothetical protein [Kribbella pittospori]